MILIIAIGNTLRRDDGAGIIAGRELESACRAKNIAYRLLEEQQPLPEMAEDIAADDVDAVLFVDASRTTGESVLQVIAPQSEKSSADHSTTPAGILTLASSLYQRMPPAWLLTIPGRDFDHGEQLSDYAKGELKKAILRAVDWMASTPCQ